MSNIARISSMKRIIVGLIISGISITIIFRTINLSSISLSAQNIDLDFIIFYAISVLVIFITISLRWYLLLASKLTLLNSLASVVLGLGGNMILPARGGDLYRAYYVSQISRILPAEILAKLFIEKTLDAIVVSLVGIFSILGLYGFTDNLEQVWLAGLIILTLIIAILVLKHGGHIIENMLRKILLRLKLENFFAKHIEGQISNINHWLTVRYLLAPFLLSILLWAVVYIIAFSVIGSLIGIKLTYIETMFVLFLVALGMSIPAAPSGIGVIHASVMSAFLLMGKPAEQGLLLGTAIHLLQLIFFTIPAVTVYLVTSGKISKSKEASMP